jgi:hypothetical protein
MILTIKRMRVGVSGPCCANAGRASSIGHGFAIPPNNELTPPRRLLIREGPALTTQDCHLLAGMAHAQPLFAAGHGV